MIKFLSGPWHVSACHQTAAQQEGAAHLAHHHVEIVAVGKKHHERSRGEGKHGPRAPNELVEKYVGLINHELNIWSGTFVHLVAGAPS